MNIIFGEAADLVPDNYTKLQLDTIKVSDKNIIAYCLVEHIPLAEFPMVENNKNMHATLIQQYQQRNWDYCVSTIESLLGAWNGEVDSFYNELLNRIQKFKDSPPPEDWDGTVEKN